MTALAEALRRRIGVVAIAGALALCAVPVTAVSVFVFGDQLGDVCLYVGHRLKNAGTPIDSDGMVSLVYLQQAAGEQAYLAEIERREKLAQAGIDTRVAAMLAQTKPNKAPTGRK